MAQQSAFFDSVNGDRPYASADFARVFRSLVRRDGIISGDGDMLAVSATNPPSLDVVVSLGSAWIQGRHYHLYGAPELLQVPQPHTSLPRIDRVVVRMDTAQAARKIEAYIKPGTPSASPVPPSLTRDTEAWEISLAKVYIAPGATQITNDDITDERHDDEVCGFCVYPPGSVFDVTQFGAVGDGATDDYEAIMRAINLASVSGGGLVLFPAGVYTISNTIVVPRAIQLRGVGREASIIELSSSAPTGLNVIEIGDGSGPVFQVVISDLGIHDSNSKAVTGIKLRKARFCDLVRVFVQDCEVGIEVDGEDDFAASNVILHPHILRCRTGILFTANSNRQANATSVIGGQIIGGSPRSSFPHGIRIVRGDTNIIFGTDIEDVETGILVESTDSGGNRFVTVRIEAVDVGIHLGAGTTNNQIIGGTVPSIIDDSGVLTNLILLNNQMQVGNIPLAFGDIQLAFDDVGRLKLSNASLLFSPNYGPILVDSATQAWYRLGVNNGQIQLTPL